MICVPGVLTHHRGHISSRYSQRQHSPCTTWRHHLEREDSLSTAAETPEMIIHSLWRPLRHKEGFVCFLSLRRKKMYPVVCERDPPEIKTPIPNTFTPLISDEGGYFFTAVSGIWDSGVFEFPWQAIAQVCLKRRGIFSLSFSHARSIGVPPYQVSHFFPHSIICVFINISWSGQEGSASKNICYAHPETCIWSLEHRVESGRTDSPKLFSDLYMNHSTCTHIQTHSK